MFIYIKSQELLICIILCILVAICSQLANQIHSDSY